MSPERARLFVGIFPAGLIYADTQREEHGDYARLCFLPFRSLEPDWSPRVPADLREEIEAHVAGMQARRGERYMVSTCEQYVVLGAP